MLTISFSPFPELLTERLILKQITGEDKEQVLRLRSDKKIMRYIPRPLAQTVEDAAYLIETMNTGITNAESINWGIKLRNDKQLIGIIGYVKFVKPHYRAEIGYLLDTSFHKKGIMQEAITTVINYGFKVMKLHSIEAIIDPDNIASAKVLEKNGFVKEAHFKENFLFNGIFLDTVYYSLISSTKE